MALGERIQELRKKKGYSQEKLAEHLSMSRQAIAKWEQNACEPNLDCLVKMATLFGVTLDYLIAGYHADEKAPSSVATKEAKTDGGARLLDKRDILSLLVLILSVLCFIGLFVYALLNPIYHKQTYSFLWWYLSFGSPSRIWFVILTALTIVGMVCSLKKFLGGNRED